MNINEIGAMFEAVRAYYPNTYGWMPTERIATTINEWEKVLRGYPVNIVKYKTTFNMGELRIALFLGVVKDIEESERMKRQPKLDYSSPEKNAEWYAAKDECMRKCMTACARHGN